MRLLIVLIPLFFSSPDVMQFSWLSGCWSNATGESGSGEAWLSPAGGSLFGVSRTVKKGETVAHEFMQIREIDGKVYFIAQPSGQKEARFVLVKLEARRAVFENAEHDFPQRVIYAIQDDGSLVGRIEGTINGKEKAIDFPMTRANCP